MSEPLEALTLKSRGHRGGSRLQKHKSQRVGRLPQASWLDPLRGRQEDKCRVGVGERRRDSQDENQSSLQPMAW